MQSKEPAKNWLRERLAPGLNASDDDFAFVPPEKIIAGSRKRHLNKKEK